MKRKYLICGDVHWSSYSSIVRKRGLKYSVRLEKLLDTLNWVNNIAKKFECEETIFLGDFFDKDNLSCEEITALQDIKWFNNNKTFLVGNHESNVTTLDFSSAKVFESIRATVVNDTIVKNINEHVDFVFIPYITTDKKLNLKDYLPQNSKKKVVFAHQDLAGIQYGKFLSSSGFDVTDIKENCTLFIDGHLHNHMQVGDNIILTGVVCGQNFNEDSFIYDHIVYIMEVDCDKISIEPYVNPQALNFYKIKIEKEQDILMLNDLKNNSVLSIYCNNKLLKKVEEIIKSNKKILEYRLNVYYGYCNSSDTSVDFTVEDHVKQFIDYANSKLDKSSTLEDELSRLSNI